MNQPWMYMCAPSWTPLPLPSPFHHSGLSQCTSFEFPVSCIEFLSISHMVICMFQCCSLKSSYPRLLPLSPKAFSLHLCHFCCFAYRIIVIVFLNSVSEKSEVAQSCPTLCDPVDYSPPGFSVHGILQARTLEWVAISFSRGSSQPRDQTQASHIAGRRFNLWATR